MALCCAAAGAGAAMACAVMRLETGGVRFAWVGLWLAAWYGIWRFFDGKDRRAQVCYGVFGALFVAALALGYRLQIVGRTGWDGLLLALGAALCLGPAAGEGALRLMLGMEALARRSRPERGGRRVFWTSLGWLLLAWLPMLLAFYPGIHAYDTFSQIPDYMAGRFSTHHPLVHTLATGFLYELGGRLGSYALGMLFYSVLQMLLLAGALAYALAYLCRIGCPRGVRLALLVLFCLGPQYSLHALGCTKDIPFAALITVYAVKLYSLYRDPALLKSRGFMAGMAAVGVMMLLLRNNAPYALALLLPFAMVMIGHGARMRTAAYMLLTLALAFGAGKGLQLATHAESGLINEMLSVPAQQLSRVYAEHGQTDPVGYEIVEFVPYAERYDPWKADYVKLHLKVKRPGELMGFIKFWGRELFHYPIEYIDAFLDGSRGYWFLDDTLFTRETGAIYLWFYDNLGVEQTSLLPGLKAAMQTLFGENEYRRLPIVSMLFQPAFYTWLCLLALTAALHRRDRGVCMAALCLLTYLLTLFLGPLVGNRYSFCMMTGAPIVLALLFGHAAHSLPQIGKPDGRR